MGCPIDALRPIVNVAATSDSPLSIRSDMAALRMSPIATAWTRLRTALQDHQAELRLCVRVTVSALLTLVLGQLLDVPLVLWAVLTAVIVTQTSVGRSLKATIDYFVGTLGGAIYAGAVAAFDDYAAEMAAIRREGLMRTLPGDALEHLFTLGFALEQLHQHFRDLERWVTEWARPAKVAHRERKG
jgi:Fusaric acid resistance protein-like